MFHACIVARIEGGDPPGRGWRDGPLPIPLDGGPAVTDRGRRSTYFEARAARTLYGTQGAPRRRRSHLEPPVAQPLAGVLHLTALEHLRATEFRLGSLLIAHLVAMPGADPTDVAAAWASAVRWKRDPARRDRLEDAVGRATGAPVRLDPVGEEPFHLAFVADGGTVADADLAREGHGPMDQWLLVGATGATGSEAPITPDAMRGFGERLTLSADWDALVLRNGAAFVGRPGRPGDFLVRHAPVHVRSVYLDAFLLGILQRLVVTRIVTELSLLDEPGAAPRAVERLAEEQARFRNALWWQHLARHGLGTDLLLAYQRQHQLPEVVERVRLELHDHGHRASLRSGRVLNDLATLLAIAATLGAATDVYLLLSGDMAPPVPTAVSIGALAVVAWLIAVLVGHNRSPLALLRARRRRD